MKRSLSLVFVAIMFLSLIPDIFAQPAKKVTLTWWAYPRFTTAGKDPGVYEQEIADRYCKENPNVSIKVEALSYNGGPAKVNVAIATNSMPDLLIDDPIRLIADYAARGALVPMDDVIDLKTIQPGFLADCYMDGKMYMYPISALCYCIGVNKTAFEKAKALDKLPLNRPDRSWTFDEYMKALEAVKGLPGMYATALWAGNEQGDSAGRLLVQNWGAQLFSAGNKRITLNDAAGVKGMEWLLSLKTKGLLAPGVESLTMTDMIDLFNQGRVAVGTYYSSDQYAVLLGMQKEKKAADFELVFFPYPTAPGVKSVTTLAQTGISVFKNTDPDKIAAAKKFAKWVCTTPDIVAMSQGHIPAVKGLPALGDTKNWSELKLMEKWGAANSVYSGRTLKGLSEIRTFWFPNHQAMFTGAKTPKQALDDFVTSANKVMEKNYP
jgi:multiple sugar transport system substrate-binding protein